MNDDAVQSILAPHFTEFGELGLAAGYLAAKGIGLTIKAISDSQEAGNE